MRKFNAFTLAEVLITLSIIGVVAAMTMPSVISKYQKHVWYNQFRKAVSQLENAIKMYEVDNECIGNLFSCKDSLFTAADFAKYFNIVEKISSDNSAKYGNIYSQITNWDCEGNPCAFITNDGMLFNMWTDGGVGNGSLLDINGPNKGPNKMGRDLFIFYLPNDCHRDNTIIWGGNESQINNLCDYPVQNIACNESTKDGCAARLLREGKMDY